MRRTLQLATVAALLSWIGWNGNTHAMTAFARKYNLKCDACHKAKIPELNEFGIGFYQNGFSMTPNKDTKADKAKNDSPAPKQTGGVAVVQDQPDKGALPGAGMSGDRGAGEEKKDLVEPESAPKEPLPPTAVYRSQGRDGSVLFTDNPYRRDFMQQEPMLRRKMRQPRRADLVQAKQSAPALNVVRPQKQAPAVAPVKAERFRNYEECMKGQLVAVPLPASAQEAMSIFMESEQRCSAYPLENP